MRRPRRRRARADADFRTVELVGGHGLVQPLDEHRHALAAADAHRLEARLSLSSVPRSLSSVFMIRAPVIP